MTLDQRLRQAAHHVADGVPVPEVDLDTIRSRAHSHRRQVVGMTAAAAVVAVIIVGTSLLAGRNVSTAPPPTSPPPSGPIETTTWTTYTSSRYGFTVGHPPDWIQEPSSRGWRGEFDFGNPLSPSHEVFMSPKGDVRVSVWSMPLGRGVSIESAADIPAWVEDYCKASPKNGPCSGIEDRAERLCLEVRDCHPAVLVPFKDDVQAFFTGGHYDSRAMTVVAVWRGETAPSVEQYGGAERLLEGFLSTMDVWPTILPMSD